LPRIVSGIIVLSIVLACCTSNAMGSGIGFSVSLDRPSVRDDLLVSMAFSGVALNLGIIGWLQKERLSCGVAIDAGMGYVANRFGHGGVVWPVRVHIDPAVEVYASHGIGSIGICMPFTAGLTDYYLFSWDDAHLYWLTAHWTGLGLQYRRQLTAQWKLTAWAHTPLISLIARPPDYRLNKQDALKQVSFFFTEPNTDLSFAFPDSYHGIRAGLALERPRRKGHVIIGFDYSWFACNRGDEVHTGSFGVRFTRIWEVGR
jgi:hypothetical protein